MLKRFLTKSCVALALVSCALLHPVAYAADDNSPVGYWESFDDRTHTPKAIIQIFTNPDSSLSGKIVKKLVETGGDTCGHCTGALHNAPFKGLVILSGMKPVDNAWEGGSIMDPASGKVYHCRMKVARDQLEVRGFIGVSLFGRSQIWKRVSAPG
ncbi:hypothetical protein AA106555_0732 [Neokomagataea thailandica NBRC 106555]|uniref:DUF2147 domain-containing protein n=2 Tax=Neokomagataea TaxID=1223423 RepID=A0A4Y6V9Y2_9PROT|nr:MULTISPECIES: DUF2147 domain-containing protein [Neokomagataea]QDH25175.1 DUF2147 domain-containing protein [Neokomagataea tanensis]GBR51922.1 hypothetical protein AA106555_0732 [Neokomagataea thailandica NBRC 106555]